MYVILLFMCLAYVMLIMLSDIGSIKYIDIYIYLNTNTVKLRDSNTNTFKYNVFKYKYIGKYFKYFFKYLSISGYITM